MTEEEIQESFDIAIKYLVEMEAIVKDKRIKEDFETQFSRMSMLQFLASRFGDLKALELASLESRDTEAEPSEV